MTVKNSTMKQQILLKEINQITITEDMIKEFVQRKKDGMPIVLSGVIQRADAKNQNGRIYPYDVLKKEIERYLEEMVKKTSSLGELDHCLLETNEVLTENGWKKLPAVELGENVYTYNTKTKEIELVPVEKTHKFLYQGKMLRLQNGKKLDITMTPNHRMILWDRNDNVYFMTADEAYKCWKEKDSSFSHSKILSSGEWIGKDEKYFKIPNTEFNVPIKAWVALFGLWIAEGDVAGSRGAKKHLNKIQIHQKKPENIQKIRELLQATEMPWKEYCDKDQRYIWSISNEGVHSFFSQFGNSETKFIPKEFLSYNKDLLSIMMDWMLLGDGRNRKTPSGEIIKEYSTVSRILAENVSEIYFKLGYRPFIKTHVSDKDFVINDHIVLKENCKTLYTVAANTSNTYLDQRFISFEEIEHNDYVYCISTKNRNFLTRCENGYVCWTGNTDSPIIELKNVSHILENIWWDGPEQKEVWGKVRLLPTPNGQIAENLVMAGIPIGISSRAVGSVSKNEAKAADIVGEDLNLICFDLVSQPSTHGAYLSLHENKVIKNFNPAKVLPPEIRIKRTLEEILKK